MSPVNGHANDSANIPTTAVQQMGTPANDTNISTALTPNAAKIKELIANLEVPFYPSVIEWRVTNTSKGGSPRDLIPSLHVRACAAHDHPFACALLEEIHPNTLTANVFSVPDPLFGDTAMGHGNVAEYLHVDRSNSI